MSQSTPINLIRRGDPSVSFSSSSGDQTFDATNTDSQLVEDILKEMGESPGTEQQSNINSQAYQYAMDSSQVPAYKQIPQQEQSQYYNNYADKLMHQQAQDNSSLLSQIGINLNGMSIKDKLIKNIKYPSLVLCICFIISLPEFNRFLFSFFPRLLLESGQVSLGGVVLKAFVGMLLFSIIVLFL